MSMSVRPARLWIFALAVLIPLIGCRSGPVRRSIEIEGAQPAAGHSVALDVTNFNGSVRVLVDEKYEEASVRASLRDPTVHHFTHSRKRAKAAREIKKAVWIGADMVEQEGGYVLRVLTAPSEQVPRTRDVNVHLTIRMPDLEGVLVRNNGGMVRLRGIHGAIQVENGLGGDGGGISVRTDRAIDTPVALTTTDGDVYLRLAPNSEGTFDVATMDGRALVRIHAGTITDVRPSPDSWTGVVNGGDNPVLMRTGEGDVRLIMIGDDAEHRSG